MAGKDSRVSRRAVIVCGVIFVCTLAGYLALGGAVYYWKERVPHYESGAVSALFALHTIQENYKTDHGLYASTFSQLGLPIGATLDGGLLCWDGPYRYRLSRINPNPTGRAEEYSIEARPIKYARGARRSYLMDQA